MKKVVLAVVFGILLAVTVTSCTKTDSAEEQELYETGIDNDEIKDEDI